MKLISSGWLVAAALVAVPHVLYAGQVYGTIVMGGQGLKDAKIEIQCGSEAPVSGATSADGTYRINVPQQGQCSLALPGYEGRPSASIFSSPNPSSFNFELAKLADGKYELKRR
jgi:hypothetical protein